MGKQLKKLTPKLVDFIENQSMFFVGTSMKEGKINISPKGLDSLRVLDENRVIWLNLTGSGNETAAHLLNDNRMTIMFCAFDGPPIILRLYGVAQIYHEYDPFWDKHISLFPEIPGKRQLIDMKIELIQTSCGMGVPLMDYKEQRQGLINWAEDQGDDGIKTYWGKKNTKSLDGYSTGILNKNKP
ncbi:pyridoxamine 5'-phosphate oxidase family protein [Croceitalea rosinachiae]|uniref:Pyridoxamine 5'-phosphate oxidase family protein n=1 Tax=Croceitalea rosinachiae TaxID=3075596 RepID=A0ABU3A9R0_9FLAO|nr:pyridoxamine 5'-phosphate oxidase family protein [Croceitalea sp. F388]MDT0606925.1 pyridoxamine 5'-phosphate oxidase family protein [Croceitalea sp. F388]